MSRTVPPKLRFEILRRDGFTCQYCGGKAPHVELQVDHVLAWIKGGRTVPGNLVTSCRVCNIGKGDREDGVVSDAVALTVYAQEITERVKARFGKSCKVLEIFALVRRNLEFEEHLELGADQILCTLNEAEDYGDFAELQRECIKECLAVREHFASLADRGHIQ